MKSDDAFDVVIVGSGAGGMAAGLTAALRGMSTVVLEKTEYYGGTTALSGGVIWVPANHYLDRAHLADSLEKGRAYLTEIVGEGVPAERLDAYLQTGPRMVRELDEKTRWVRWRYLKGYSDYYPEVVGGYPQGRALEPLMIDGRKLGALRGGLRPPFFDTKGFTLTASEFHDINMIARSPHGTTAAARVLARYGRDRLTRMDRLAMGQALIARLRLSLQDANVPVLCSSRFLELTVDGGRVTGVRVERDGREQVVVARRGVILAAGGFGRSQEMRSKYLPAPSNAEWTLSPDGQTGDGIEAGVQIGAAVDFMDRLWGQPSALLPVPGAQPVPIMLLSERANPGTIVVNSAGERFTNESAPYNEFTDAMYARNRPEASTVPSWFVFDQRAKNRYVMLGIMPRQSFPDAWFDSGFVRRAATLADLAADLDLPRLPATVERFNAFVRAGHDDDFGRGDSVYDRYYGDPSLPQPNLQQLVKGPFYAIQVYPCDIGTKGGLLADENARVLREDGNPIPGLYATGNTSSPLMGGTYAGPGATIGPAMVFGYIAADHIYEGGEPRPQPSEVEARLA